MRYLLFGLVLCVGILIVMAFTPLENDIVVASLDGNKCIKEREGAILEENPYSLTMKYTMESEEFNIFCYNEIIADMNSQNLENIWTILHANNAIVKWNGKDYYFTRPDKNFVITDSNVNTLLTNSSK